MEGVRGSMQRRWTKVHSHLVACARAEGGGARERRTSWLEGGAGDGGWTGWKGERTRSGALEEGRGKAKSEKELRAKVRSVPGSQGVKILKGSPLLGEKVSSGAQPSAIILFHQTAGANKQTHFLHSNLSAVQY